MATQHSDKAFSGSIAELYHSHLTPLIFESYAQGLAKIVNEAPMSSVLEVAAGTGVVTRAMVDLMGNDVSIVATDLNQPMIDFAQRVRCDENICWVQADAMKLPFEDGDFDAVACQFAVMFFPDRARAYSEARRVLKPGGRFVFSVWDHIGENEFADTVERALGGLFPSDPPMFLSRTPYGYFDIDEIVSDLRAGGFTAEPIIETVADRSRAESASFASIAFCQGTPMWSEIVKRDASMTDHAMGVVRDAFASRFGDGEIEGKMQAHVFCVRA